MRRRSERGKGKPVPPVPSEESSEKSSTRKSNRYSRRRRKSSSSSGSESKSPKKDVENNSKPLEVQVQDIELPQEENPVPSATTVTNKSEETEKTSNETQKEWKEDNTFWESGQLKSAQEVVTEGTGSGKDKEGSSLWKVESANGAGGGGEIQKLKICRQRPTESPESGDSSLRKRLSRGTKDGRSTDDSTHEESEKDTKQSKHRTRTSSKNSPMVSPTVVCDLSEGSPTKIKIINVSHFNSDNKEESVLKTANEETVTVESVEEQINQVKEDGHKDTLDIALPADEPSVKNTVEQNTKEEVEQKIEPSIPGDSAMSNTETSKTDVEKPIKIYIKPPELNVDDNTKSCSEKLTSSNSSTKKEDKTLRSSRSSSADSDSSNGESKPRKVKKKRRRELQSSVQRKRSSDSPKHESSDSEDGDKKTEAERRGSTETQTVKSFDKENEADNSLQTKDSSVKENNEVEEKIQRPMPRKRRWGSSLANRANKKPILSISTDSLKSLIPDAKPVPAEELQLSVEEEEGQLDDDEEDDEVVIFVAKEEEKQLERERQKEERQKEREKEQEEKRKKQERLEKKKSEQPPPVQTTLDSGAASRKILLLTEDAKKLARSPSPPRHRPASVLYITHLVRPFTVQQLKNLLLRTGTIVENGFWIDKIKSKCYVEYTTEDAAVETRHALHGVRWPTSNPKTLVVEFASHDDLVMAQALSEEPPELPKKAEPLNMVEGWVAEQARIKERSRRAVVREWDVGKPEHPDEVLEYDMKMKEKREQERKARKERPHRSATPDAEVPARKARRKDEDAPAKLLDDLFRKTKTSPCIYWLPLTQEQIAVKEEIRRQHMAEHERRMAELKKADLARRERERRNRK